MFKKPYKQFHHGKGIPKTSYDQKPMKWIPWTYIDSYNIKTGKFHSRRKFNHEGWAYKDMDVADYHKPYDHVHDIYRGNRLNARYPNKKERKEFEKAKQKRRFWV